VLHDMTGARQAGWRRHPTCVLIVLTVVERLAQHTCHKAMPPMIQAPLTGHDRGARG